MYIYGSCFIKQHSIKPQSPCVKYGHGKEKKFSIYDFESRRVTGDRNFLVEWSDEKKIPKNNFKLFNDENNSENAWLVNIYDSMDFIIAVNTSKTSNLTTDDFPLKFKSEFYNPQKQVRAYILEWFFIHYYHFYFMSD